MKLFWEIAKKSFQRQITYRAATLAGLATNIFFGLLRAAVIAALYGARPQVEGITMQEAITYTGISQGLIAFLSLFSWYDVMRSVYSGEVGSDLLKPMNYFSFWMAQDLGRALVALLLRGLPIMAFYALFFGITRPESPFAWLALACALFLAWMVSFCWRFLINLAAFWVPNAVGIGRLFFTLSWFLSGFLMPLRFFPTWFQDLANLTPFPHTINTVVEVYLGLLSPQETLAALLAQVGWVVALAALGALVLRSGVRRLVVLGG